MAVRKLVIENFKGIGFRQTIDLAPITLLFGANSAGKSTVLHALNYLNDIVCHFDPGYDSTHLGKDALDLGGFKQFVHMHELERVIVIGVDISLGEKDLYETAANRGYRNEFDGASPSQRTLLGLIDISEITKNIDRIEYVFSVAWSEINLRPYVQKMDIAFGGVRFVTVKSSSDSRRVNIEFIDFSHPVISHIDNVDCKQISESIIRSRYLQPDKHALIGVENAKQAIIDWRKPLEISDIWEDDLEDEQLRNRAFITALLECLVRGGLEALAEELGGLSYLGPLRKLPERTFRPNSPNSGNWATGLAAWEQLYLGSPTLLSKVNEWLSEKGLSTGYCVEACDILELGADSQFLGWLEAASLDENRDAIKKEIHRIQKRRQIVLRDLRRNVSVLPNDVGVGISQILPVIIGAVSSQISIFSVEQPEIHIHPRLQVALGDLFIENVQEKEKLFIIETHSEHLVLRLLRRIREKELLQDGMNSSFSSSDLNVVYAECVDGETRFKKLRVTESGKFIDRWPEGFFDERYEELDL